MIDWIQHHEIIIWGLVAASIITFVVTLVVVPLLVVRIPSDYFARRRRHRKLWADQYPVVRVVLDIAKNLFGYIFIVAGILMLVLPGQGLLTILVGIMLIDFPGKYQLERWIVARRPVLRFVNWLRQRAGQAPLVLEG